MVKKLNKKNQFLSQRLLYFTTLALLLIPLNSLFSSSSAYAVPAPQPRLGVDPYRLGSGDAIKINIFDFPEYSGDYLIPLDGVVSLPLVGAVSLMGLTLQEAETKIVSLYADVLKYPKITINLTQLRPVTVTVTGEVTRAGVYPIALTLGTGSTPGIRYPKVTEALQLAGGITLSADLRRLQVRRQQPSGVDSIIEVNLAGVLNSNEPIDDLTLRDGDTIVVPALDSVNLAEASQLATTSFSTALEQPRTVAVIGEVNSPGTYVLIGGPTRSDIRPGGFATVTAALQQAGGITPRANIRDIQIRRRTGSGTENIISINLWEFLQAQDPNQDTLLQEGDTVVVPTATSLDIAEAVELSSTSFTPATITVYVVGERPTQAPLSVQVPFNSTLNQALLAAGGLNSIRANDDSVNLVRLNPDGTVVKRRIKLDLAEEPNEQNNPLLKENDIIIVRRSTVANLQDTLSIIDGFVRPAIGARSIFGILEAIDAL